MKMPFLCTAAGQLVSRVQRVMGVDFMYQPPPKSRVPYAAALKIQSKCALRLWPCHMLRAMTLHDVLHERCCP